MAKRQTDVNINYKVNTVDIERGNGLLARASKATDDLRRTTQQLGTQGAQAYKFQSRAIEGMEIEVARLKQQVKLANTQNVAEVQKLTAQYRSAKTQLDAYNKSLLGTNAAQKQTAISARGVATQFGEVYSAIKLIIAAGLVRELAEMSLNMARLNGNIEGVERAFNRAFPQSKTLLEDLRRATHGTVSDFELMQRTLQATNLGVNVDQLATLFEFAAARAQQTGESVDYLVNSIVRGIGRKSVLVLDNLGLSATRLKEQFDGVSIASKSVAEVTEGVAEIAKIELEKMGGYLETSATTVDQTAVAWQTFKKEVADSAFWDAVVANLKGMTEAATALIRKLKGESFEEQIKRQQREEIALATAREFMERRFTKDKKENIKILQEEIQALTEDLGFYVRLKETQEELNKEREKELKSFSNLPSLNQRQKEREELQKQIEVTKEVIKNKTEDALIDQEVLKLLRDKLVALQKVNAEEKKSVDEGPRAKPEKLTQVVDIRFKDPVTGAITKEHNDKVINDLMDHTQKVIDFFGPFHIPIQPFIPMTDWEKALEGNKAEIVNTTSSIIQDQIDSIMRADVDAYQSRIDAARDFYSEQIELAGDNERAKDQLRIKEDRAIKKLEQQKADREKKAAKAGIRVSTALGIMKVFAGEGTFADKLIKALIVAAQGASQLIIADRARYYAKGEIDIKGPGSTTSDSIPARLSRGESVMTAEETLSSKGIFKAVRAKKLNDKVLQDIVSGRSGGAAAVFDDSKIVQGLQDLKNSQPDLILRGNQIYEARRKGDNYKQIVRSKSFRK